MTMVDPSFVEYDESIDPIRSSGFFGRALAKHEPTLEIHLHRRAAAVLPAPPSVDLRKGRTQWDMLGNDQEGDCGPASVEHARMVKAMVRCFNDSFGNEHVVYEPRFRAPHTGYTLELYWKYGKTQGEAGSRPDQGVVLRDYLLWLYQNKQIEGFAEVNGDPTVITPDGWDWRQRLDEATYTFEGLVSGVSLTDNAEGRFMRDLVWAVGPNNQPDPALGHAVYRVGYDSLGCEYITWGANQRATLAWEQLCANEHWVVLTEEDALRKGVDWASLTAALDALPLVQLNPVAPTATSAVAPSPKPGLIARVIQDVEKIPLEVESEVIKLWDHSTPNEQFIAKELVRLLELSVAGTPQAQLVVEIQRLLAVIT